MKARPHFDMLIELPKGADPKVMRSMSGLVTILAGRMKDEFDAAAKSGLPGWDLGPIKLTFVPAIKKKC